MVPHITETTRAQVQRWIHKLKEQIPCVVIDLAFDRMMQGWTVEVGWRATCGRTVDNTQKQYDVWQKIVRLLQRRGYVIEIVPQKHGNAWASRNGGFWNSETYRITNLPRKPNDEEA